MGAKREIKGKKGNRKETGEERRATPKEQILIEWIIVMLDVWAKT